MTFQHRDKPLRTPDKTRDAALGKVNTRIGTLPAEDRPQDRHGRGLRGPLLFPSLPGWRTRREDFYSLVQDALTVLASKCPDVDTIEFGVEEAPPSDPAEWERHDVVLARAFPRDRRRGLADRIVLYRLPIVQRGAPQEVAGLVYTLLARRIAEVLDVNAEDLLG